ncbi:MAG: Fic family protein [Bacilli bacterium]|jgi:Fic family protein
MRINPRMLINKKTGKIYFNSFIPRPLQEIEKELVFDIDVIDCICEIGNLRTCLKNFLKEHDFSPYLHLFKKLDAYYSLKIFNMNLNPITIFAPSYNEDSAAAFNGYLTALDFSFENYYKDFQTFFKEINAFLITDCLQRPGKIRKISIVKNSKLIPVHPRDINISLNYLFSYLADDSKITPYLKASLVYYQFLAISPFQSGNHRQARILLATYFLKENIFPIHPFSLSYYFYLHKEEYQETLINVRVKGDYQGWIKFFLLGIAKTLKNYRKILKEIVRIKEKNEALIENSNFSRTIKKNLFEALSYISTNPVTNIKTMSYALKRTYPTTATLVKILEDMQILTTRNENRRNRTYIYKELIQALYSSDTFPTD